MNSLYIVVIFRFCLFTTTSTSSSNAQAPGNNSCGHTGNWSLYEGQCYSCKSDQVPWQSARSSCSQLGAHLVTISNSGIQTFVQNLCNNASFWIGLNDLVTEGTFVWDEMSTPISYLNWAPGEPNNAGDEDCAHVSEPSTYQWNDEGCDWNFSYICQRPKDIDDCSQDPCQNNGTCTDLVYHFQCDCVPGFNGTNCEIMINECLPGICLNNGTCTDLVDGFKCDCVPGFIGTNCENDIDDCQPEPCQNNGTCTDLVNDYQCGCVAGYNGTNCENDIDDCSQGPCQNNGTCINLVNGYQCDCVPGFYGTNCENDKYAGLS